MIKYITLTALLISSSVQVFSEECFIADITDDWLKNNTSLEIIPERLTVLIQLQMQTGIDTLSLSQQMHLVN